MPKDQYIQKRNRTTMDVFMIFLNCWNWSIFRKTDNLFVRNSYLDDFSWGFRFSVPSQYRIPYTLYIWNFSVKRCIYGIWNDRNRWKVLSLMHAFYYLFWNVLRISWKIIIYFLWLFSIFGTMNRSHNLTQNQYQIEINLIKLMKSSNFKCSILWEN